MGRKREESSGVAYKASERLQPLVACCSAAVASGALPESRGTAGRSSGAVSYGASTAEPVRGSPVEDAGLTRADASVPEPRT